LNGTEGDGTAFNESVTVEAVSSQLFRQGFQQHGNEVRGGAG
jgi:hypothetical protein